MAAKVMVEALRRAGSHVTREKLVAALESMGEFDLGGLTVRYGPGNHIGSQYSELTIVGRDGKLFRCRAPAPPRAGGQSPKRARVGTSRTWMRPYSMRIRPFSSSSLRDWLTRCREIPAR